MTTETERKPALDAAMVTEFVGNAHGDLNRVKELLATEPSLINAANDWGAGDWETGLGAAGHMGRRDIAEYLLERGARTDLFVEAMLGHLDVVKALLTHYPEMLHSGGPHGITLHAHAKAGGDEASAVANYLRDLEG